MKWECRFPLTWPQERAWCPRSLGRTCESSCRCWTCRNPQCSWWSSSSIPVATEVRGVSKVRSNNKPPEVDTSSWHQKIVFYLSEDVLTKRRWNFIHLKLMILYQRLVISIRSWSFNNTKSLILYHKLRFFRSEADVLSVRSWIRTNNLHNTILHYNPWMPYCYLTLGLVVVSTNMSAWAIVTNPTLSVLNIFLVRHVVRWQLLSDINLNMYFNFVNSWPEFRFTLLYPTRN